MSYLRLFFYMAIAIVIPFCSLADSEKIQSVEKIQEQISALLEKGMASENIVVVWDFHGVITKQRWHENELTLNPEALAVIKYLEKKSVSQLIATAWNKFDDIQEAVISLKLASYFDVEDRKSPLQNIPLKNEPSITLEGHQNGKVVALKKSDDKDLYFRRKAFALEHCFPNRLFEVIFFIDDDEYNVNLFEQDFKQTLHGQKEDPVRLVLYHLQT